ncbi:PEP-CTERM sorting domain-containing protein [Methyloversatilis discipulorum]|uniref:PEP-CTERM sorting domain-containing protein n=1 Tax=Methyloversatilis discipulorum TaxID=1119528 RepID=UPI001A3AB050|nr:PEP-CTERM sorting domain-containing protein [Methyloversatilis discipulorum]MBL8466867.1 hypothetical protein [Methyloversatilis discipulorum]
MSTFRSLKAALMLAAFSTAAHAGSYSIIQTFSGYSFVDYGNPQSITYDTMPTGDWILTATVNDDAVRLPGNTPDDAPRFRLASLTLTQVSLGLHQVEVTSLKYLSFHSGGFSLDTDRSAQYPWQIDSVLPLGIVLFDGPSYAGAETIRDYIALMPRSPLGLVATLDSSSGRFDLADGRSIFGKVQGGIGSQYNIAVVPEPAMSALLLYGLGTIGLALRMRRAHSPDRRTDV